jgi:hypothetical protein
VEHCGLHDLGFAGHPFTWWNKRQADDFATARLNKIFASVSWISAFDGTTVNHLVVQKPNHCLYIPDDHPVSRRKSCSGLKQCG